MTKANKQKALNLMAGVIDAKYMIARVQTESEKKQWQDHANNLLDLIAKLKSK